MQTVAFVYLDNFFTCLSGDYFLGTNYKKEGMNISYDDIGKLEKMKKLPMQKKKGYEIYSLFFIKCINWY